MMDWTIHYPVSGLLVFFGAVFFLRGFDYLAAKTRERLKNEAGQQEQREGLDA